MGDPILSISHRSTTQVRAMDFETMADGIGGGTTASAAPELASTVPAGAEILTQEANEVRYGST